jgi:hypothetical protein
MLQTIVVFLTAVCIRIGLLSSKIQNGYGTPEEQHPATDMANIPGYYDLRTAPYTKTARQQNTGAMNPIKTLNTDAYTYTPPPRRTNQSPRTAPIAATLALHYIYPLYIVK